MAYNFKTIKYQKCEDYRHINLNSLYDGNAKAFDDLYFDLECIITTEAPLTMNTLKERMREVFELKKISGKALEIIEDAINEMGFPKTDNLFDTVLWSLDGIEPQEFIRLGYNRQIYDIPKEEMKLLSDELKRDGYFGENHHRKILEYFGYEVLTEKANEYLDYIENN